jgi:ubiquinone/menaquinone biosynthesis C-methylase UbiE
MSTNPPMSSSQIEETITNHYGQDNLEEIILTALENAGKNINALTRKDIATFEEFHFGGRPETRALAELAQLEKGMQVLDVGSGVGGAARTLAGEFGCQVTGLELTEAFCRAAEMLTDRVGLSDRVTFHQGSATDMFFENGSFDAAWLQHVSMNIKDKRQLFAEIRRVVRPRGRLALHEIMEGPASNVLYPVFWASNDSISFLGQQDEIRELLTESGFAELEWEDVTERTAALTRRLRDKALETGPPPLGLNVIVPGNVPQKAANSLKNLEEGRIVVIQAVYERTS